jgi:thiol-disulfide isomerase/thioredoxin
MLAGLCLAIACPRAAGGTEWRAVSGNPPQFTLSDSNGASFALGAQHGRPVLVHFFATWCEPCRDELPALGRLVAREQKVAVLAISVAEMPIRVRRFLQTMPVSFPILLDEDRAVARAWDVHSLPTTFVLDRDLKPRLVIERDHDWDKLDSTDLLQKLSNQGGDE